MAKADNTPKDWVVTLVEEALKVGSAAAQFPLGVTDPEAIKDCWDDIIQRARRLDTAVAAYYDAVIAANQQKKDPKTAAPQPPQGGGANEPAPEPQRQLSVLNGGKPSGAVPQVTIINAFCAAAGDPKTGSGTYGLVMVSGEHRMEKAGRVDKATKPRMELYSVVAALHLTNKSAAMPIVIHSDSAYIVNSCQKRYFDNWKKNGWLTSSGKAVEHRDLWEKLIDFLEFRPVTFILVNENQPLEDLERAKALVSEEVARWSA